MEVEYGQRRPRPDLRRAPRVGAEPRPGHSFEHQGKPEGVEKYTDDAVRAPAPVEGLVQHDPVEEPCGQPDAGQGHGDAGDERQPGVLHQPRGADRAEQRDVAHREVQYVAHPEPHRQAGAEDPVDRAGGQPGDEEVEELAHAAFPRPSGTSTSPLYMRTERSATRSAWTGFSSTSRIVMSVAVIWPSQS